VFLVFQNQQFITADDSAFVLYYIRGFLVAGRAVLAIVGTIAAEKDRGGKLAGR